MTRREAVEAAQFQIKKLHDDLNSYDKENHFSIIDSGCNEQSLIDIGFVLEPGILFLDNEMKKIEEEENSLLPDEGNPGVAVGG